MKYLYIIDNVSYLSYMRHAGKDDNDLSFSKVIENKFAKKIFEIHMSWTLNKKIKLPLKKVWWNFFAREIEYDKELEFVLINETHKLAYTTEFLQFVRCHSNLKLVFIFINPVSSYLLTKVNAVRNYYNLILTFNEDDALRYGFTYFNALIPLQLPIYPENDEVDKSDVFFVGADKGRLRFLVECYEKLKSEGYKCIFIITEVTEDKKIERDGIRYNEWMDYDLVLKHIANTKCLLDILPDGMSYYTFRTREAFKYKKKVITNNASIVKEPFYDKGIFQIINTADEIKSDFIDRDIPEDLFKKGEYLSNYESLKAFINNRLNNK